MKLSQEELSAAWTDYKSTGNIDVRNRLVVHYEPLVAYVSSRINVTLSGSIDRDDLYSYGIFGLFDAIEKFDPGRNIKFETYAVNRVRGAIIDELRSIDWVPRSVRTSLREIEAAKVALEEMGVTNPTEQDLADMLDWSIEEVRKTETNKTSIAVFSIQSILDVQESGESGVSTESKLEDIKESNPDFAIRSIEIASALARGVSKLSERELLLLILYYVEELTLSDIGSILGVTESRVCQIHTKAIADLQENLGGG